MSNRCRCDELEKKFENETAVLGCLIPIGFLFLLLFAYLVILPMQDSIKKLEDEVSALKTDDRPK